MLIQKKLCFTTFSVENITGRTIFCFMIMPFNGMFFQFKEMKYGSKNKSRRQVDRKHMHDRGDYI